MDILEVAKKRRGEIAKEIAKLDEFIAFGEQLSRSDASTPTPTPTPTQEAREESASGDSDDDHRKPLPLRQFAAGS